MNTIKYAMFGMAAFAVVAGCKTIKLESAPNGANIKSGEVNTTAPTEIQVNMFTKTPVKLTKAGYKDKELNLAFSTPNPFRVTLEKYYNINANVDGATVKVAGAIVGKTPLANYPINEFGANTVTVSKPGWLDAELKVTPETPTDIMLTMEKDMPGRYLLNLRPTETGIDVKRIKVHSDADVGDDSPSGARADRLTTYNDDEYVQNISLLPDGKTLVASVIKEELSKDGKGIRSYYANLWKFDATASDYSAQQVTSGDFFDITPNASVDSEGVYFATTRNGRLGIRSLKFDNPEGQNMLTAANTADYLPAVSPDGTTLVYTAVLPDGNKPSFLWTKAADGNGMCRQLCEGYNAVWSPDGSKILFVKGSMKDNKASIWIMDANGTNRRQIGQQSDKSNDIDPRWSPDGTKIVFSSNRGTVKGIKNYDIWMMDADGRNVKQLTTNSSCDDRPVFAPDGNSIYFRSNRGLTWDIWVMKLK